MKTCGTCVKRPATYTGTNECGVCYGIRRAREFARLRRELGSIPAQRNLNELYARDESGKPISWEDIRIKPRREMNG